MAPKPPAANPAQQTKKRKDPPPTGASHNRSAPNKRQKTQRDARTIAVQTTFKAFKNGELDVDKFVKAREYEIRALEEGLERSKRALSKRAFQQVPKELRRRTASHNVKRVPKKLQGRAKREMVDDNTPTVTARRRKPTRHMRLRLDTVKRLRALGAKRKDAQGEDTHGKVARGKAARGKDGEQVKVIAADGTTLVRPAGKSTEPVVKDREPRIKRNMLKSAPTPPAKFRKRQMQKSWLPTHIFHAKRAHMTLPKEPLWRFSIPLTSTQKSYRPTHRVTSNRGAIAWDMSYMSTIGLEGVARSLEGLLRALGVQANGNGYDPWGMKGQKWRSGTRTWEGWLYRRESAKPLAPVTIIWRAEAPSPPDVAVADADVADVVMADVVMTDGLAKGKKPTKEHKRSLIIRVHPSAFYELWEETMRLCKVQKPQVTAEDLRFDVGSIEVTGPGSTEALLGALKPAEADDTISHSSTWTSLIGVENPAVLPSNALLAFSVQDPRLEHPPRTVSIPSGSREDRLLRLLVDWPCDRVLEPGAFFDRKVRAAASRALPSQKAINRRKALAPPGAYPDAAPKDPRIPLLLYTSRGPGLAKGRQSSWTVLLPWKAVLPVWYSLTYYPLSTGGQVRFGGLEQQRQISFEAGVPWFPGDYPGTEAGNAWEVKESARRKAAWDRRPKGKRIEFDSVTLGPETKGEIGAGWACDWARLIQGPPKDSVANASANANANAKDDVHMQDSDAPTARQETIHHLPTHVARSLLDGKPTSRTSLPTAVATIRLVLLTRGVPTPCARIYRLPSPDTDTSTSTSTPLSLRNRWLALLPSKPSSTATKRHKTALPPSVPADAAPHLAQQRLAADLLRPVVADPTSSASDYPNVPGELDLIGFVTTGEFCLAEGKGVAIGSVLLERVVVACGAGDGGAGKGSRICIVRNAGERLGRLARWELV